jgi:hypothetical protein
VRSLAKADRLAIVLLAAGALLLFRESVLEGGVFYKRDIHLIWHPQVEGFVHAVTGGALPLWDPSPAFGQPLLGDPGAQVLYPPTWLNLVLRPWTYYTLFALGHVLFSAVAFYAFGRRLELSPGAALAGAAAWSLSGPFLSLVDLWHHFASAAWIPLAFLVAEGALRTRRPRDAVRLGLVLGAQLLAGSADVTALTLVALLGWAAMVHAGLRRWPALWSLVRGGVVAGVIAAGLSAGLWATTLDVASRSSRHVLPEAIRTYWSAHPFALVEMIAPGIPGGLPLTAAWGRTLFEGQGPFLASLYLGLPFVGLIGAAFASRGGRRRWAFGVLLVGACLVALGRHAPVYDLVTSLLPPLRMLRYPVKAMVIAAFGWAGLVALGTEAWRAEVSRRRWLALVVIPLFLGTLLIAAAAVSLRLELQPWPRLVNPGMARALTLGPLPVDLATHAALATIVLALALARILAPRFAGRLAACAAILATADLALAHPRPNPVAPVELYTHRPEVLSAIGDPAAARVYSYDYTELARAWRWLGRAGPHLQRAPLGWAPNAAFALAQQMSLSPQTPGRWALREGFDIDYRGLQAEPLADLTRFIRLVEDRPADVHRLLRIGAVTHVVAHHEVARGELRLIASEPGLFSEPILVFAVPDTLPRVHVVDGVRVADGIPALMALVDPGFEPGREVVLPEGTVKAPRPGFTGTARVVRERADRLRIEAELDADGFVVVADSYDPGWRVRVDGLPARLLRANVAFRAVALRRGRHVVEMAYRPTAALVGVALSVLTLGAALLLLRPRP